MGQQNRKKTKHIVGCLFGLRFEGDLLGPIRVSQQPVIQSLWFMWWDPDWLLLLDNPTPPKACLWTPFILSSLFSLTSHCRTSSIPIIPQLPPPSTHANPSLHHPLTTPLETLTSKAFQLNMSLIREGGVCSLGVWGGFSTAIYHCCHITHTIRQSKKAPRFHEHTHSGLLWTSVLSSAQHSRHSAFVQRSVRKTDGIHALIMANFNG